MPRTALIVKLAAIGDVVMALPMVSALRAADPDVRICWMAGTAAAPLLGAVDGIAEVVSVDEAALLTGGAAAKAAAVIAARRSLAGRRFDAVYVAHSDRRYLLLVQGLRTGVRRFLGENAPRPGLVPGRTHADEYVRLVTGVDDHRATRFPAPRLTATLPAELAARVDAHAREASGLVALAPGGARNAARDSPQRRWPLDRYAALARTLAANGYGVVVTGGPDDVWIRAALASTGALDLVGATDLPGLVALYRRCAAVVTHDSGPLHLARLAAAPVVALFGPTTPTVFLRDDATAATLWPAVELPCAPCYDGREFAACDDNRCMQLITVEAVLAQVRRLARPAPDAR